MPTLHIVGLGPGSPSLLTEQARQVLSSAREVLLRTMHPAVEAIPLAIPIRTYDPLYESGESFEEVYRQIVEDVLRCARAHLDPEGLVIVAVGDRSVIEPQLRELSLGPVQALDLEGEPVP